MGATASKKDTKENQIPLEPTGLYPTISWDLRQVKRLILSKKLAPFYSGKEGGDEEVSKTHEECPICFLYYEGGLNRAFCCKKSMCTECFLQIKKPTSGVNCPFCNRSNLQVIFTGPLSREEREKESLEQQRVIELKIKMRQEEIERDEQRAKERRERGSLGSSPSSFTNSSPASFSSPGILSTDSPPPKNPIEAIRELNLESAPSTPSSSTRSRSPSVEEEGGAFPLSFSPPRRGLSDPEPDWEELMFLEAIRLSLVNSAEESRNRTDPVNISRNLSVSPPSQSTEIGSPEEEMELALAIQLSLNPISTN